MTRYAHQSGFHVERRFGWDCHGLPVEYEIDKTIGIKVSKKEAVKTLYMYITCMYLLILLILCEIFTIKT